ncbi:MAG: hypothetical protein WA061_02605 [Microgenomates group bacterium]
MSNLDWFLIGGFISFLVTSYFWLQVVIEGMKKKQLAFFTDGKWVTGKKGDTTRLIAIGGEVSGDKKYVIGTNSPE